jgi:hypothetical protein
MSFSFLGFENAWTIDHDGLSDGAVVKIYLLNREGMPLPNLNRMFFSSLN